MTSKLPLPIGRKGRDNSSERASTRKSAVGLAVLALFLPTSLLARVPQSPNLTVVLVPGITGSELRHRESGEIVWGTGARVAGPRDDGWSLFLPLDTQASDATRLEATRVIEELRLALLIRKPIYGPILDRLGSEGFTRGDLRHPRPEDRLFAFAYDWRRDAILTARLLGKQLERVRVEQGQERLRLALICQSNGGQICRYLARFGATDLAGAEAGRGGPPEHLDIRHLFLVGTAADGSLRVLRELDRGRRYLGGLGRRFAPEVLFSFPSLFQELPSPGSALFLDSQGRDRTIDLYSFESWRRHGWSIYAPEIAARIHDDPRGSALGTANDRRIFLSKTLDRAARFRRLLAGLAAPPTSTRYHLVGSTSKPTPSRAQVRRVENGHWQTLFTGDSELERPSDHQSQFSEPGDGHATLASLQGLSPSERAALAGPPLLVDAPHFEMILESRVLDHIVEVLLGSEE